MPGFRLLLKVRRPALPLYCASRLTCFLAMNVLRMIKLFGWERKMTEKVAEKREEELRWLWKRQILDLINGNLKCVFLPSIGN